MWRLMPLSPRLYLFRSVRWHNTFIRPKRPIYPWQWLCTGPSPLRNSKSWWSSTSKQAQTSKLIKFQASFVRKSIENYSTSNFTRFWWLSTIRRLLSTIWVMQTTWLYPSKSVKTLILWRNRRNIPDLCNASQNGTLSWNFAKTSLKE